MGDSSSIRILPTELLLDILVVTHPLSILHCRQASRRLKDIIDASNDLKIVIDLFEHGFLLINPRERPLPQVWTKFVRDQKVLLEGDASKLRHVSRQGVPNYIVTDGMMVKAGPDNPFFGPGETSILQLSSFRYSGKPRDIDFGVPLQKEGLLGRIAISRQHNVLLVAEMKAESSQKHPRYVLRLFPLIGDFPKEPRTLTLIPNDSDDLCHTAWGHIERVTLYEQFVAITVKSSQARLPGQYTIVIWDWKNGQRLAVLSNVRFFAFLSSRRVVVLYEEHYSALWVISLQSLAYRRLIVPDGMSIAADDPQDSTERGTFGEDYVPDRNLEFFLLRLSCVGGSYGLGCVISKQKLDRFMQSLDHIGDTRSKLAWDEWGPSQCRILERAYHAYARIHDRYHPYPTAGHYQTVFHGDKLCSGYGPPRVEMIWKRCILDFNPRPIRRGTRSSLEVKSAEVVDEPSILTSKDMKGIVFPLESRLPYRRIHTDDIVVCEAGIWPSDLLFL